MLADMFCHFVCSMGRPGVTLFFNMKYVLSFDKKKINEEYFTQNKRQSVL
jgi:hypothetical protein